MEDYKNHLYALIYCGGGGTRLWPYSREKRPKQFLAFDGDKTLIRKTLDRVLPIIPIERIYVITLPDYTDEVRKFIPEIPKKQVIVEPARRDTLLAAGLGAVVIRKKDPKAIIANLWADQLITGVEEYRAALLAEAKTAWDENTIVTCGVKPGYAHPGLEYVRKGPHYGTIHGADVYKVDKFIERPERSGEDPEKVFKDKSALWHLGLWMWKVEVFMEAVKKSTPETYARLEKLASFVGTFRGDKKIAKEYEAAEKVQIDMVISKGSGSLFVVEGHFEWLDVGDFGVLWRISEKDKEGNALILKENSDYVGIDTKNSLILSEGEKQVATIGLEDLIVVVEKDAVLVARRDKAQKVKEIVNLLKEKRKEKYL